MPTRASLISMAEIAELANVRRPVVSTWRRRFADFPAPVRTPDARSGVPLFDADAVVDWLAATGHGNRRVDAAEVRLHQLRVLGDQMHARLLVGTATALICLRHLDGDESLTGSAGGVPEPASRVAAGGDGYELATSLRIRAERVDPDDRLLRAELEALRPEDARWLAPAVDELIEAAYKPAAAFERLLAARHRLDVPELYADAIVPELAQLVVKLSGVVERLVELGEAPGSGAFPPVATGDALRVADPAARGGDLLRAVLDAASKAAESTEVGELRLFGLEPDRFLARLARRRLVVAGLAARDVDIRAWNPRRPERAASAQPASSAAVARAWSTGGADVVVTCLPFRPAEERRQDEGQEFALIRDIADRLEPRQTAVVIGPAELLIDALPVHRSVTRRRNELLASGRLEAVVALPGGMVPFRPAYRTALWVLRRDDGAPARGRVLLADLRDLKLATDVVDTLAMDVTTWRREGFRPELRARAFASQALIADLISVPGRPPVALIAPRPGGEPSRRAARTVARVRELEIELAQGLTAEIDKGGRESRAAVSPPGQEPAEQPADCGPPDAGGMVAERDDPRPLATVSIGELARVSSADGPMLRVLPGARIEASDIAVGRVDPGQHGTVTYPVIGAPELTGQFRPGERRLGLVVIGPKYPKIEFATAGDVIATVHPRLGVLVDDEGSSVVQYPARILRLTDTGRSWLTPRVLAALLTASSSVGGPSSGELGPLRRTPAVWGQ